MPLISTFEHYSTGELALLALFGILGGLARGFSGFGSGLIFMPLAGMVIGPKIAAPVLLIIDLIGSLPTIRRSWRPSEKPQILTMLMGASIGMPMGIYALLQVNPVPIRWVICGSILLMLALLVSGRKYSGPLKPPVFAAVGIASGLLSGIAQIGGPPIVAFWLGSNRSAATVRANIMFYFTLSGALSLCFYTFSGLMDAEAIALSLIAAPGYLIGVLAGIALYPLASPRFFHGLSLSLIGLAALLGMPLLDHLR